MKKEQMVSRKHLLWMEDENFQSICVGFFFFVGLTGILIAKLAKWFEACPVIIIAGAIC